MKAMVVYYSLTGNTRKIAEAMAIEIGCEAESVETAVISEELDYLFIGAAVLSESR